MIIIAVADTHPARGWSPAYAVNITMPGPGVTLIIRLKPESLDEFGEWKKSCEA